MANLDQVVAVQSLREPAPQTGFVDRLLVAAERFGVAGLLCLNKIDEEEALQSLAVYREMLEAMEEEERRRVIEEDDNCDERADR